MSLFQEFAITWDGKEYVVPADQVMTLIEQVEEEITLEEMNRKGVPRAKVSKAFLVILRFVGVKNVTQEDLYSVFFSRDKVADISGIILALQSLMIPPSFLQGTSNPDEPKKKNEEDS